MRLTVRSVDYNPPELGEQLPFSFELLRCIAGPDRSDYWLGRLDEPLHWLDNGRERMIEHLIICARWQGTRVELLARNLAINIAYVIDPSQIDDQTLSLEKCRYVAIGIADEAGRDGAISDRPMLSGFIRSAFGLGKSD